MPIKKKTFNKKKKKTFNKAKKNSNKILIVLEKNILKKQKKNRPQSFIVESSSYQNI